jgi:hypothetical protein
MSGYAAREIAGFSRIEVAADNAIGGQSGHSLGTHGWARRLARIMIFPQNIPIRPVYDQAGPFGNFRNRHRSTLGSANPTLVSFSDRSLPLWARSR